MKPVPPKLLPFNEDIYGKEMWSWRLWGKVGVFQIQLILQAFFFQTVELPSTVHRQSNQFKQLLLIWAKISPLCNPNYHHQSIWRIFLNKGSSGGRSLLRVCILQGRQEIWQCSAMLLFWWQLLLQDKKKTEAVLWGSVSCSASLQKEGMQFYKSLVLYFCF